MIPDGIERDTPKASSPVDFFSLSAFLLAPLRPQTSLAQGLKRTTCSVPTFPACRSRTSPPMLSCASQAALIAL